jgi:hypothetical protein
LAQRSKIDLTSCAIELAGMSCARSKPIAPKKVSAKIPKERVNECRKGNSGRPLKIESRLITHGSTVEHVAWRCCGPLSVGAFSEVPAKRETKITGRDWFGQAPVAVISYGRNAQHAPRLLREISGLRGLINLEGNYSRTNEDGRGGDGIGSERRHIQPEHEIVRALQTDAPERLTQEFVTLTAMKFVQEIIEVTWRRLLVPFQAQQLADVVFVKFVHALREFMKQDFCGTLPSNFAAADSRKRAGNVPCLRKLARFY